MNAPINDYSTGHIPNGIVYGPVSSRRFGKSLGVSFSFPDSKSCAWSCPYCQLGHLRPAKSYDYISYEDLQESFKEVSASLHSDDVDVLCVSGSGEPFDHPDIASLFSVVDEEAFRLNAEVVVLTNGDAFMRERNKHDIFAKKNYWKIYIKWDPIAQAGAWSGLNKHEQENRFMMCLNIVDLRLQSMFFATVGQSTSVMQKYIDRWIEEVAVLQPIEVHIMSIERRIVHDKFSALSIDHMEEIAETLSKHIDGTVEVFG